MTTDEKILSITTATPGYSAYYASRGDKNREWHLPVVCWALVERAEDGGKYTEVEAMVLTLDGCVILATSEVAKEDHFAGVFLDKSMGKTDDKAD
jgi:hypothetical protein